MPTTASLNRKPCDDLPDHLIPAPLPYSYDKIMLVSDFLPTCIAYYDGTLLYVPANYATLTRPHSSSPCDLSHCPKSVHSTWFYSIIPEGVVPYTRIPAIIAHIPYEYVFSSSFLSLPNSFARLTHFCRVLVQNPSFVGFLHYDVVQRSSNMVFMFIQGQNLHFI